MERFERFWSEWLKNCYLELWTRDLERFERFRSEWLKNRCLGLWTRDLERDIIWKDIIFGKIREVSR